MIKKLIFTLVAVVFAISANAEYYEVKRGDTISGIFSDILAPQEINSLSKGIKDIYPDFVLRTGMKMLLSENQVIINAAVDKDIIINISEDGRAKAKLEQFESETVRMLVTGEIKTNLFDAVKDAGEDAELAAMLASIFEWEIDFFKDLRSGDKFAVLIEKKFINNKYAGYGRVIAADFYNKGKLNRAVYFENGKTRGYFNEEGRALERGFLRVPLNYARITSRFTNSRLHPVLKEVRPHYGVDYAAPTGTPVMATATGVVEIMGYKKGNGNYIALRHANGYKTYYLHLHGFHKSLRKGSPVNQGQIIGYVGSTGYSTGPHLDYRINRNGKWLNPLKFVATPKSLKKEEFETFALHAEDKFKILDDAFPVYAQTNHYNPIKVMEF
ncbi:MAG: peptidoglycan DD-metalloendopeptidase family protein [Deferribacterales bacterium]|nr:peptidoglycan DD-metalloendopeptidase family protein [Deferribacterales bacterium]